jgi:hypothetical protein
MIRMMRQTVARAFRRAALPLGWYYAVTLALPIANGATLTDRAFVEHAVVVLAVPLALIVVACVGHALTQRLVTASVTSPARAVAARRRRC